ncbi:DUF916 and DUF3324 domain-containing protein [Vagococcus vulneris]|uniref:Uncharacterized protein n=1 Tax=Vagococcus vulneris TaxID=1977869 RepID=A0A429ZTU6_9ENTE|nr:DUF916 and DUF3324 domain-containing protein [Vagococcus vulneris]RST97152.1 hypothetical protein CBF37_10245 [Vagococcus vulneris]
MKKLCQYVIFPILAILSLFLISDISKAADDTNIGFTVDSILPSSQLDKSKTYFYVQTEPSKEQTLEVRIKSTKKEKTIVKIMVENASTSSEGNINYGKPDKGAENKTLTNPITSMIKPESDEVEVQNFEEKVVKLKLTPPAEHYDGVKMGALIFEKVANEKSKATIKNKYNYKLGVITSENGDEFTDGDTLELLSVKPELLRGQKVVRAFIQNPQPKVIQNLTMRSTITDKKTNKVIKKNNVTNYSFAPNSTLPFIFDWGISNLPSGTYTLSMKINNNLKTWNLKKDFTISGKQAQQINDDSPYRITTPLWIKIVTIILYILTITNIILIFTRRKKWNKEMKKSKKRKHKNKRKGGR